MQNGTSKGNEPTVKVLEIAQHQDRKPDDLLPYVGPLARFFRKLPNNPNDLILKTAFVPLNDIECFTKTIIDVPESVQNFSRKKGKWVRYGFNTALTAIPDVLNLAQAQFLPLCGSWDYEDWDEYDYSRIKSLKFRELQDARIREGQNAVSKGCLKCPDFLKHVSGLVLGVSLRQMLIATVCHGARPMAHQGEHSCSPTAHVRPEPPAAP